MEEVRSLFEDARAKYKPPESTSPEECEEVEIMLSSMRDDQNEAANEDSEYYDSDIDDSFATQGILRHSGVHCRDKLNSSPQTSRKRTIRIRSRGMQPYGCLHSRTDGGQTDLGENSRACPQYSWTMSYTIPRHPAVGLRANTDVVRHEMRARNKTKSNYLPWSCMH